MGSEDTTNVGNLRNVQRLLFRVRFFVASAVSIGVREALDEAVQAAAAAVMGHLAGGVESLPTASSSATRQRRL